MATSDRKKKTNIGFWYYISMSDINVIPSYKISITKKSWLFRYLGELLTSKNYNILFIPNFIIF